MLTAETRHGGQALRRQREPKARPQTSQNQEQEQSDSRQIRQMENPNRELENRCA
jgi:hypothetical protein